MTIEVLAPILFLFLLLIMAVPVGVCLAVAGLFGLFLFGGLDTSLGILQTTPYRTVGSYALTTIPMFVLMAEFATESGITKEIFALPGSGSVSYGEVWLTPQFSPVPG